MNRFLEALSRLEKSAVSVAYQPGTQTSSNVASVQQPAPQVYKPQPAPSQAPEVFKPKAQPQDVSSVRQVLQPSETSRHGGSLAWRNQNPGNIRFGDFAKAHGATQGAKGFASFPTEESGTQAGIDLLKTKPYQKLNIGGAISRWAPPIENDTKSYIANVSKTTGLDANRPMSELGPEELNKVFSAIRKQEGWKPGKE